MSAPGCFASNPAREGNSAGQIHHALISMPSFSQPSKGANGSATSFAESPVTEVKGKLVIPVPVPQVK
jgi:hypothetical protein